MIIMNIVVNLAVVAGLILALYGLSRGVKSGLFYVRTRRQDDRSLRAALERSSHNVKARNARVAAKPVDDEIPY